MPNSPFSLPLQPDTFNKFPCRLGTDDGYDFKITDMYGHAHLCVCVGVLKYTACTGVTEKGLLTNGNRLPAVGFHQ